MTLLRQITSIAPKSIGKTIVRVRYWMGGAKFPQAMTVDMLFGAAYTITE